MPLVSQIELKNLKLKSILSPKLKELSKLTGFPQKGSSSELIKNLMDVPDERINLFIKKQYKNLVLARQKLISDEELKHELLKVENFSWSVIQGQLDQKIQTEYVRKIFRYDDIVNKVKDKLHDEITNYVVCTWYNHWTTVLIEEHIAQHPKVIPTLKSIKGVDIFFGNQPFDLKTTYLPKNYSVKEAIENPKNLAVWMYENQGAQRFGADNRLFVILLNTKNPEESWKLKRNFKLVFSEIDKFFDTTSISANDEIVFEFGHKTYATVTKVLLITI